ncbi:HD-like signal output (HDOD) protein [Pseudomonas duriflava]|uniref:HD-like signal output (HDOD) protein n=1 Tax=Pseudomonas duriflava TaxID=459528 RepID=A0A562QPY7_9PSED|nr:HDOD domain-containing protein [Pseudomonas duriflava]TWI58777.1 HD-like signal output (HDOD) protein [Pseudomonas duriflava]
MTRLADKVAQELIEAIDNDRLVLPTLPEIALRVREVAEDPNVNIAEMSKVISTDTALTARIVKVVNSPLLRIATEITDLHTAVCRLGINYTCNLAIGLAMEQMFQATTDVVDRKMREVWSQSTEIAGISHVLCRHFTPLQPDQATLAGLVHQIGILPILTFAEENDALLADSISLDRVIEQIHPMIGRRILETWDFQDSIACVPEEYLNFERNSPKVDYADIVQVAYLQSHAGTEHPCTRLDWSRIVSFSKLGFDPQTDIESDEDLSLALEQSKQLLQ